MNRVRMMGLSRVRRRLTNLSSLPKKIIDKYSKKAIEEIQRNTPVGETGKMKDNWYLNRTKRDTIIISNRMPYAKYVLYGTKDVAPIYPKTAKFLHWVDSKGSMFLRSVDGQEPQKEQIINQSINNARGILNATLRRVILES